MKNFHRVLAVIGLLSVSTLFVYTQTIHNPTTVFVQPLGGGTGNFTSNAFFALSIWTNDVVAGIRVIRPIDQSRSIDAILFSTNYFGMFIEHTDTNTDDTFVTGGYFYEHSTNSGSASLYFSSGVYGLLGEVNGNAGGLILGQEGVGLAGDADSSFSAQYGVQGTATAQYDGQTNIGVAASALINGKSDTMNVGLYAETYSAGGIDPIVAPRMESAVILADSRNTGNPLFVGRTNGVTTYKVRSDGSIFMGANVGQDTDEDDYGTSQIYSISMVNSNEAPRFYLLQGALSDENYDFYTTIYWEGIGDPTAPLAVFHLDAVGTNNHSHSIAFNAQDSAPFIDILKDGIEEFSVSELGDLSVIKSVPYSWPTGHGAANSVLTDTVNDGTLSWQPGLQSTAGTNEIKSIITNQMISFIHGSTNRIAKFTPNTNEVGNSIMLNTQTNLIEYKSFDVAYTNIITNLWYAEWTSANNWRGMELTTDLVGNNEAWLRTTHGSGYTGGNDLLGIQGWTFGAPSPHGGQSIGGFYPNTDNSYDIGSTSSRPRGVYAGPLGHLIWGQVSEYSGVNLGCTGGGNGYGFGCSETSMRVYGGTGGSEFMEIINTDVTEQGLNIGVANLCGNFFHAFGKPNIYLRGNPNRDTGVWQLGTNCTAKAIVQPYVLTGIWGSGTDIPGGDNSGAGGVSTGTGTNGNYHIKTAQKAASTSAAANTLRDRMVVAAEAVALTTNSATAVCTIALPTSGKHVGVLVFATTTISDGTDQASLTETFTLNAWNKAGTVTTHVSNAAQTDNGGTGSASIVSTSWTATVSSTTITLKNNVVTAGINSTTSTCEFQLNLNSNDAALAVVPQL